MKKYAFEGLIIAVLGMLFLYFAIFSKNPIQVSTQNIETIEPQKPDTVFCDRQVFVPTTNTIVKYVKQQVVVVDTVIEHDSVVIYQDTYLMNLPLVEASETYSNENIDVSVKAVGFQQITGIEITPIIKKCPTALVPPCIQKECLPCPKKIGFWQKIRALIKN